MKQDIILEMLQIVGGGGRSRTCAAEESVYFSSFHPLARREASNASFVCRRTVLIKPHFVPRLGANL